MRGSQQNAHAILTAAIVAVTQEWLHVLLQNAIFNLFLQSEAFSQSLFCLLRSKTKHPPKKQNKCSHKHSNFLRYFLINAACFANYQMGGLLVLRSKKNSTFLPLVLTETIPHEITKTHLLYNINFLLGFYGDLPDIK